MKTTTAANGNAAEASLPPEAWVHVLSFVDAASIANCVSLVSHSFHALTTEPQLWRRLVLRDFPASSTADSGKCNLYDGEPDGWRKTFYTHRWLQRSKRPRFCLLGHVDCGKSTLLGRMLLGLGQVTQQEVDRHGEAAMMMGKASFKYAWCSDSTPVERERGLTIEWKAKECRLTSGREIEIVDVPGHGDFKRSAFIAASMADVAMLVVAAGLGEFEAGVGNSDWHTGGTLQHMMLAKSLGMSKVIVVVNKMDSRDVNYSESRFTEIKDEMLRFARRVGFKPEDLVVVPISAWIGENVVTAPSSMPWYKGPMLFEAMEQVASAVTTASSASGELVTKRPLFGPTRVSVLRRANKRCNGATDTQKQEEVVKALVQSGMVHEGQVLEAVVVAPITTARRHSRRGHMLPKPTTLATFTVLSIQRFDKPRSGAAAGEYIGLRLRLEHLSPAAAGAADTTVAADTTAGYLRKSKWATPHLRGGTVLAAADAGTHALTSRVESFTVRLEHAVEAQLRRGSEPYFIIHSAARPYRVEKVLKCWGKNGQEVTVDDKAATAVTKGMSTLVQVKPIGDVYVEPFASNAALGTVLVANGRQLVASGRIESVLLV